MATQRNRLAMEQLEQRRLLTVTVCFAEGGQQLGMNHLCRVG